MEEVQASDDEFHIEQEKEDAVHAVHAELPQDVQMKKEDAPP